MSMRRKTTISNVELTLAHPVELDMQWVGQERIKRQLMAAWLIVDPDDLPLNPRLVGRPGIGKTTLAYSCAREMEREVYIYQSTMDTRPEDLLITPVLSKKGKIAYHASAVVTAMIRGGIVILDEANRMPEKSWASLAPLMDRRRYIESIVTGIVVHAHPDFRIVVTLNSDVSTFEIPEYILTRLSPLIEIDWPSRSEEYEILRYNLPFAPEDILEYAVNFLQRAHAQDLPYAVRDGINIGRYALKLAKINNGSPQEFLSEATDAIIAKGPFPSDETSNIDKDTEFDEDDSETSLET